jgi:uncharacterized protein (DUF1330 family)
MAAYCLFDNIEIKDMEKLAWYKKAVAPVVKMFEGEYVVLGGKHAVVEGNWHPTFVVMLKFPDYEMANRWYFSEEYNQLKAIRQNAVVGNAVIIEGLE